MNFIFSEHYHPDHHDLYRQMLNLTLPMTESYPKYSDWFYTSFLRGLQQGNCAYIIAKSDNDLAGCCLMKKTADEQKISTLFVHPDYRHQGVAHHMMDRAMSYLGSDVGITVSSKHLSAMTPLLCAFGFHLCHMETGLYTPDETEYFCHTKPQQIAHQNTVKLNYQCLSQHVK